MCEQNTDYVELKNKQLEEILRLMHEKNGQQKVTVVVMSEPGEKHSRARLEASDYSDEVISTRHYMQARASPTQNTQQRNHSPDIQTLDHSTTQPLNHPTNSQPLDH
jgi:hypothetical protein